MLFVLALLSGMGLWQLDFLVTGISANVFLNSCIFATFFFGIYAAFTRVLGLKNDIFALKSLREDYEDAVNGEKHDEADSMWRYYRCEENAIVIYPPKILERPYTILSEEIAQTQGLKVTTGVMQNLLDSVDEQLDEGRSLISYVTGLLVFLGLIGTFIGLMVTLGSVGDIIGGLDLSGGAGAEAIQKLMDDLMIPLQGMATGFSSSLFGLITSLALGLVALFGNQAANSFKAEFATWLAGVAKVGNDVGGESNEQQGSSLLSAQSERTLSVMYRVAKLSLVSNARIMTTVEAMSASCQTLMGVQRDNQARMLDLSSSVQELCKGIAATDLAVRDMSEVLKSNGYLKDQLRQVESTGQRNAAQLAKITKTVEVVSRQNSHLEAKAKEFATHLARRDDVATLSQDFKSQLQSEFFKLHGTVSELTETVSWLDEGLDDKNKTLLLTTDELAKISQTLRNEVEWAIAESKEALSRAESSAQAETNKHNETSNYGGKTPHDASQRDSLIKRMKRRF
ncbi:MAG: hypothetical protein AAF340_04050 [Pseudomonadota bacterium]